MLLFTYCRSAWVGIVVAFVVVAALQERKLLLVIAVLVASVWAWVPSVSDRLDDLDNVRVEGMGDPNSFAFRQRYWGEIFERYVDGVPLEQNLTGIGLGMVEETMPDHLEPHNVWVQVVSETGAIGTVMFVTFVVTIAVQLGRGLRRATDGVQRGLIVGVAAASANMLVQSVAQNLITEAVIWTYFATVLALGSMATMVQTRNLHLTEPADPDLRRRGAREPVPVLN
ncbi:MAG: O-antigen ligase family protein [Acidimicrobiales bacterium]